MDINAPSPGQVTPTPDTDPRLPPEIEYTIFVFAFHNDQKDQPTLLCVARRVSQWLLPLLYKVVAIGHTYDGFRTHPPLSALRIHGHHVRHLSVMNWGTPQELISSCPNVSNLMLWFGTTLVPDILNLPVERFAARSFGFLEDRWASDPNEVKLAAWCSKITHIALATLERSESHHLTHFPALEYLMILGSMASDRQGIMRALQHCPRLKVVVWLLGPVSDVTRTQAVKDGGDSDSDIRIVKVDGLITADWTRGAQGLEDMWDVAEEEVRMRREDHRR